MGDRTPIEVRIYSCPPERVGTVLAVFEEFRLEREFGPLDATHNPAGSGPALELGRGYIRGEISVGSSEEIATALPTEAAWMVWEDPAYEHLGQVHMNHPDLGVFVADCDAQGHPVWTSDELDRLVQRTDGDRVRLGHLTGRTWTMAFANLDLANNGIVLARDAASGTARLQASALNQLASGPSRWMPADAPGQANETTARDR